MSIDNDIRRAFERHADDIRPETRAWETVQGRIRRRHRSRIAATAMGAALAIVGVVVLVPRIGSSPSARFDAAPADWSTIRSFAGGYRIAYPPGWKVTENVGVTLAVPPDALSATNKPGFSVVFTLAPEAYDRPPGVYRFQPDETRIRGRRANRYSEGKRIETYRIEWPRLCAARKCHGDYTLIAELRGPDQDLWNKYRATGLRIIRTAEPTPVSDSATALTVRAKIRTQAASALSASSDALWAIVPSPDGAGTATLVKIDPTTDRITQRISIGVAPADVAASPDAVWVSHGRCFETDPCHPAESRNRLLANSVWRIDPRTGNVVAMIALDAAGDIALGEGSVWVAGLPCCSGGADVVKIDPTTNRIAATLGVGGGGDVHLVTGGGYLWGVARSSSGQNVVSIVDTKDYRVIEVLSLSAGIVDARITFGFGYAWATTATNESPTAIARIEPKTWRVADTISLPEAGNTGLGSVVTGEGFVWTISGRGELWKVDAVTDRPVGDPTIIGDTPPIYANDLITAFGSVWVASGDGQIWRIAP